MLHELTVDLESRGKRLDVWLESRLEGCSRSLVQRCLKAGRCTIHPGQAKAGYMLRGGEQVSIEVPEVEPIEARPEDIPLTILYEDDDLVIVDKPAGMVVHPAVGHLRGTLVNALLGRYGGLAGDVTCRPGIIHRLDADTSGVIAVARSAEALAFCQDAFRERRVKKRYLALVHGYPRSDYFEHRGWIGHDRKDFRQRIVVPDETPHAQAAETHLLVRAKGDGYSVVEARPLTGRTHQIRVHLADRGHACLADALYSRSSQWPVSGEGPQVLRRHALHAWRLELPHPDGRTLTVEAPIPADLAPWVPAGLQPL